MVGELEEKVDYLLTRNLGEVIEYYKFPKLRVWGDSDRVDNQVEIRLLGAILGYAQTMSWGMGINPYRQASMIFTDQSKADAIEMYRFGVALYRNVTIEGAIRLKLFKPIPEAIDYLIVDYYLGVLLAVHQGQIVLEESLLHMLASTQPPKLDEGDYDVEAK